MGVSPGLRMGVELTAGDRRANRPANPARMSPEVSVARER